MTRFLAGIAIGIVVGALGASLVPTGGTASKDGCMDLCGAGTECAGGRCVAAATEAEPSDAAKKPRRPRRTRKSPKGGTAGQAEFVPMDDSHIPEFDRGRVQHIDMSQGTDRLSDAQVSRTMAKLENKLNRCIETAAEHSPEELGSGTFEFVLSVEPSGRVSSVSVKAPKSLDAWGIVPCLRVAVSRAKFPARDGPIMGVDYSFDVR